MPGTCTCDSLFAERSESTDSALQLLFRQQAKHADRISCRNITAKFMFINDYTAFALHKYIFCLQQSNIIECISRICLVLLK
jgi:hypothetical protein